MASQRRLSPWISRLRRIRDFDLSHGEMDRETIIVLYRCPRHMTVLRSPGLWLLLGGLEALFLVHLAEFLYPGYSVSENYISELGTGPTTPRVIFTAALISFGLMVLTASHLLRRRDKKSRLWLLLGLSAVGAIGVGVFDMDNFRELHGLSALLAFLFGNLAAIYSAKTVRPPLSYLFILLGLIGLSALALLVPEADLGLGLGGIERMIFYPAMFWLLMFGVYMMAEDDVMKPQGQSS